MDSSPLIPPSHKHLTRPRRRLKLGLIYFLLPLLIWLFTSLPLINRLTPFAALILLAFLLCLKFLPKIPRGLTIFLSTLAVLTLVGSSGWFFSPFFFALYLTAIALGFIYTPLVATGFTLGLTTAFVSSIGEVSPTSDFLTLVSLLSVIPITMVLRKSFLLVQQEKKGILILETDDKTSGLTSLDSVLKNQINNVAITLRQPITYIRQAIALIKANTLSKEEFPEVIERMSKAADETFTLVKEFESETTKNVLLGRKNHE